MQKKSPWYVEERLHALAVVLLTEREDLVPETEGRNLGIDFRIEILEDHEPTGRRFGVELMALDKDAPPRLPRQLPDVPYPVCLFAMRVDEGIDATAFYAWTREPIVTPNGKPLLGTRTNGGFEKLNRQALDEIVRRVNQWYDALMTSLAG